MNRLRSKSGNLNKSNCFVYFIISFAHKIKTKPALESHLAKDRFGKGGEADCAFNAVFLCAL